MRGWRTGVAGAALVWSAPLWAQAAAEPPVAEQQAGQQDDKAAAKADAEAAGDTATVVTLPGADEKIDEAAVPLPALAFKPDPALEKDFDKYYYFHRADTDFRAALADLRDCDGFARGLASPFGNMATPYPYAGTLAGAAGGAIANIMVAAIFGSAQLRATRRITMRRCMFYKGYQRFGVPKDLWQAFNFEEGFGPIAEDKRQAFLMQQAKVAAGARQQTAVLGR